MDGRTSAGCWSGGKTHSLFRRGAKGKREEEERKLFPSISRNSHTHILEKKNNGGKLVLAEKGFFFHFFCFVPPNADAVKTPEPKRNAPISYLIHDAAAAAELKRKRTRKTTQREERAVIIIAWAQQRLFWWRWRCQLSHVRTSSARRGACRVS